MLIAKSLRMDFLRKIEIVEFQNLRFSSGIYWYNHKMDFYFVRATKKSLSITVNYRFIVSILFLHLFLLPDEWSRSDEYNNRTTCNTCMILMWCLCDTCKDLIRSWGTNKIQYIVSHRYTFDIFLQIYFRTSSNWSNLIAVSSSDKETNINALMINDISL